MPILKQNPRNKDIFSHPKPERRSDSKTLQLPEESSATATNFIDAVLRLARAELNHVRPTEDDRRDRLFAKAIKVNKTRFASLPANQALGVEEQGCLRSRSEVEKGGVVGKRTRGCVGVDADETKESPALVVAVQCSGWTKAGSQCKRRVTSKVALSLVVADIERFCYQHRLRVLEPSGFYARKTGKWIEFADWIPQYMHIDTQAALRVEMEKARSPSDVPGYIYTFEIRDSTNKKLKLKVGRAVNIVKRVDQWGKQCGSKEHILRGFYPEPVTDDQDKRGPSKLKGLVKAGQPGPWCHRLERLIHLELADLAAGEAYLDPAWPKTGVKAVTDICGDTAARSTPKKGGIVKHNQDGNKPCDDCGKVHQEIFEFTRMTQAKYKGQEWEHIVLPVIQKWGAFVEAYV